MGRDDTGHGLCLARSIGCYEGRDEVDGSVSAANLLALISGGAEG